MEDLQAVQMDQTGFKLNSLTKNNIEEFLLAAMNPPSCSLTPKRKNFLKHWLPKENYHFIHIAIIFSLEKIPDDLHKMCFLLPKRTVISNFTKTYVDTKEELEVTTSLLVLHNDPIPGKTFKVFEGCFIQLMSKWFTHNVPHTIMLTITLPW